MGSINAQQVARKVSDSIRMNKKVVLANVIRDTGYSDSIALKPHMVTRTNSYKKALALESIPLIEGLQVEINRMKQAIANKDYSKEELRTLIGSLDILIHNYQLLSGGATERQVFVLPSEVIERNNIQHTIEDKSSNTNNSNNDKDSQVSLDVSRNNSPSITSTNTNLT